MGPPQSDFREQQDKFNTPRRWAGRLAFPLLAVAVLLAWRGVRLEDGEASPFGRWGWWTLSALAIFAGLLLLRIRHRRG